MYTLLIEDNQKLEEFIRVSFQVGWPGAKLNAVHLGDEGIDIIEQQSPDLIIIEPEDLSDIDGYDLLKQIRLFSDIPIVIITGRSDETTVAKGLELGADEYIVKPVGSLELLARVRAIMRRQRLPSEALPLVCGRFCLYPITGELIYNDRKISLTRTECLIIQKLIRNSGQIVPYTSIAQVIWGEEYPDSTMSIRSHIKRLRAKLRGEESQQKDIIQTKPGIGYSLSKF
jgi:two-component system KDP operon response regulator KdpE